MGEPTIPEAAVEAAAKVLHARLCLGPWERCNVHSVHRTDARAALAAAEPLMQKPIHLSTPRIGDFINVVTLEHDRLTAENARLREALTVIDTRLTASTALGVPFVESSRDVARAALAPSDGEPGT